MRAADDKRDKAKLEQSIAVASEQIKTKLLPVYDANDGAGKWNTLASPLLRRDMSRLVQHLDAVKTSVDQEADEAPVLQVAPVGQPMSG